MSYINITTGTTVRDLISELATSGRCIAFRLQYNTPSTSGQPSWGRGLLLDITELNDAQKHCVITMLFWDDDNTGLKYASERVPETTLITELRCAPLP